MNISIILILIDHFKTILIKIQDSFEKRKSILKFIWGNNSVPTARQFNKE